MSKWQPPEGNSTQHPKTYIFVLPSLFLLLLLAPPSSLASPPALLSLLIPWAQEQQQQQPAEMGAWRQAALEALGEAPFAYTPGDERRLLKATLESGRLAERTRDEGGSWGGATAADWESPRDPDLFLLTEVAAASKGARGGRRRQQEEEAEEDGGGDVDRTTDVDEMAARRVKRTGGLSVGGSRIRTSVGGGVLGSVGGGRGGIGGLGSTRGMGGAVGGGISGGPSLSIVNPLDVLRQRLLLEIARRRMRQSEDQILANRELLKSIGKREAVETDMSAPEATGAPQSESTTKKPMSM